MDGKLHKEGDIYKIIELDGRTFALKYGYYSEHEREKGWPVPIMPDFITEPSFSSGGFPYATRIQDSCEHYRPKNQKGDFWCGDCEYYSNAKEDIGLCLCDKRKSDKK